MLSIQKVILLSSDFHYVEFRSHLIEIKAELPLKLVEAIREKMDAPQESDELCEAVYGSKDEKSKKKFFQLVHHTFRLTSYLSRNYPSYLTHNIARLEALINKGELKKANELGNILIDVAEKIEDYHSACAVLKFLAQQAYILEDKTSAVKHHKRIAEIMEYETTLNDLYLYIRQNLNFKGKSVLSDKEMVNHLVNLKKLRTHPSMSVNLLSRYAWLYSLNFLNDDRFYSREILNDINDLTEDLDRNNFVIFSFSDDIQLNVDYLKLKHLMYTLDNQELQKESAHLIKKREALRFWKNYVNTPEIIFLSIQCSYFLSEYNHGYRKDYNKQLPLQVKEEVAYYKSRCVEMLNKPIWEEGLHVRYINLQNIYSGFLILGTDEEIRQAVANLEALLVNFQQIPFHRLYDALFATLILGLFFLQDHLAIQECYKRYEKLTAGISKNLENDLTVKCVYYASQWIHSQRKQYLEKLQAVLNKTKEDPKLKQVQVLIEDIAVYFTIELK
ncbi:MAG: hypothetical protein ACHQRM_05035 [Bacteroidia bacterium]